MYDETAHDEASAHKIFLKGYFENKSICLGMELIFNIESGILS